MTPLETQCKIITEMWLNHRNDDDIIPLIQYFDMGFPLAYAFHEGLIKLEPIGEVMISECWEGVLEAFGIDKDTGFETFKDISTEA